MTDYFMTLFTFVLNVSATVMCVSYIFRRRGYLWILPSILSLFILAFGVLFAIVRFSIGLPDDVVAYADILSLCNVLTSFLWMASVISMRTSATSADTKREAKLKTIEKKYRNNSNKTGIAEGEVRLARVKK